MAPKKSGFLDKLKDAVMADDGTESQEAPAQASSPSFANIPNLAAPQASVIQAPYRPVAAAPSPSDAVDPQALKMVRDSVYLESLRGQKSRFIQFLTMYGAVGNNVAVALNALKAVDPNFNAAGILEDIAQHEMLLQDISRRAETEFAAAANDTVGKSNEEAAALTQKNETARAEIARHTSEITEREARLKVIAGEIASHEAGLAAARKKTADAEAVVRAELLQTKQTLSALQ